MGRSNLPPCPHLTPYFLCSDPPTLSPPFRSALIPLPFLRPSDLILLPFLRPSDLGSFQSEEEAAHMFDRAAIRLRGHRAKLNYNISEYTDASV